MDDISDSCLIEISEQEIKDRLLKLLKTFDVFCQENGIKYSITSGTFLGAIRHNGFIPWDDDIDVGLVRSEYEKLLSIINNQKIELSFIGVEIGNGFWPFLKLVDKNTIISEMGGAQKEYLWIDIFPFDNTPVHVFPKMVDLTTKRILVHKINAFLEVKSISCKNGLSKFYNKVLKKISKKTDLKKIALAHVHFSGLFKKFELKNVGDIVWGTKAIPKYLFSELIDYKFENIIVKGFKDYNTYLTSIYGDYMKLPPEEQRINHGVKAWRMKENEE